MKKNHLWGCVPSNPKGKKKKNIKQLVLMGLNYIPWTKIIINNHRCRVLLPRLDGCKTQPHNIDLGLC